MPGVPHRHLSSGFELKILSMTRDGVVPRWGLVCRGGRVTSFWFGFWKTNCRLASVAVAGLLATSCKSTRDTVPYFGINGLSMILCLWSPLQPLSKLLPMQDHTQNLEEQLWMGGRREVSFISHRPVTRSDLKQERSWECLNIFASCCLSPYSRGARLLNGVKRGALFAPKRLVIKK